MKITIYELLGLIKDGKAPKKIKYKELIIEYDEEHFDYWCENLFTDTGYLLKGIFATDKNHLNDEVIIPDEEDEFIDIEELNLDTDELLKKVIITAQDYVIEGKINEIIKNQKKIITALKENK